MNKYDFDDRFCNDIWWSISSLDELCKSVKEMYDFI